MRLRQSVLSLGILALATATVVGQDVRVRGVTPRPVSDGSATEIRRMDPAQMLRLTLVLQPPRQDELQKLLREVEDPKSPRFHRFLTFDQWKARYAPSDSDVAKVDAWAAQRGLKAIHHFRDNLALKVEANAQTIEQAFNVLLHHYKAGTRTFFSNDRDPVIPGELMGILKNVHGLSDYVRVHAAGRGSAAVNDNEPIYKPGPFIHRETTHSDGAGFPAQRLQSRTHQQIAGAGNSADIENITGGFTGLETVDLYSSEAYDLNALKRFSQCCNPNHNPGGSPKETSIAIIGTNTMAGCDLTTFAGQYNMATNLTQIMINSPSCCDNEITLDIEAATAMANSFGSFLDTAHIYAYEGGGTLLGDLLDAWHSAHSDDNARNASSSFGQFEDKFGGIGDPSISDFTDTINAMASEGWSMAVATGDHGATQDCQNLSVTFPASSPNVVAVGGTTLSLATVGGQPKFTSEVAWTGPGCGTSDQSKAQNLGGGGGGCSNTEPKGFWQTTQACGNKRALPDIALNAGTGEAIFYGSWVSVGGTSIASPEFAGFLAHENSYLLTLGNICTFTHDQPCAPFGNPNPPMQFNAGVPGLRNPYYDITSGCNGGDSVVGYCTNPGYDLATGWGSVNMFQLAWVINEFILGPGAHQAQINFTGPATNNWYNTDQHINFSIGIQPFTNTNVSVGVAGYGAQWDSVVPDILTHATPGSGDSFYDGPPKLGNSDFFSLASAGPGCHTAHVRAFDNIGQETFDETYGPVCYDAVPPVVSCDVPDHFNWHSIDISVFCSAQDALSGLANPSDANISLSTSVPAGTETANAFTNSHAVCDIAGNCATAGPSGPIKIDKKPPSIVISQPTATQYLHSASFALNYSVTDLGSGVGSVTPTMDASATVGGHGLANGQVINLLTDMTVGQHTFLINAADQVGNQSSSSVTFTIYVTPQSIKDDITEFVTLNAISKNTNSLLAKLDAALKSRQKGNCNAAGNQYGAFINEVNAQTGKSITPAAAAALIADANYLISHCP